MLDLKKDQEDLIKKILIEKISILFEKMHKRADTFLKNHKSGDAV